MAKKSKTQRAKASAARQARKAERMNEESTAPETNAVLASADSSKEGSSGDEAHAEKKDAKSELVKKDSSKADKPAKKDESESKKVAKRSEEKKPKKKRFQFLHDVKAELKRVTWPTRIDVLRWSGVVVAALLFFGIFVAILDNFIVTPLLVLISGADPSQIDWLSALTNGPAVESSASDASGVYTDQSTTTITGDSTTQSGGADVSGTGTEGADTTGTEADGETSGE